MKWSLPLLPQRPQPESELARRIVEWTDVAYYTLSRVICLVVLILFVTRYGGLVL